MLWCFIRILMMIISDFALNISCSEWILVCPVGCIKVSLNWNLCVQKKNKGLWRADTQECHPCTRLCDNRLLVSSIVFFDLDAFCRYYLHILQLHNQVFSTDIDCFFGGKSLLKTVDDTPVFFLKSLVDIWIWVLQERAVYSSPIQCRNDCCLCGRIYQG